MSVTQSSEVCVAPAILPNCFMAEESDNLRTIQPQMNILHLNGDVFDLDQVISKQVDADCIRLTFRNGDQIPIQWRDERERSEILESIAVKAGC